MKLFENLFHSLNDESVRYLVAGGIAVNLYGIERATADIDIVLDIKEENLSKFIKVAKKLDLRPKVPVALDDFADENKREEWKYEKSLLSG